MVLALYNQEVVSRLDDGEGSENDREDLEKYTFQSLASRCNINGSSGSLISPASSSSVFLTFS